MTYFFFYSDLQHHVIFSKTIPKNAYPEKETSGFINL